MPAEAFDAFKTASSRGAFFNHEIRDRYVFREVTRGRSPRTARKLTQFIPLGAGLVLRDAGCACSSG
ncbi:MAG: KTSC domain-containing protein [Bradyrhizobium sp.]